MITRTRVVSALLGALLLAGPLAPFAGAQQPAPPAQPAQPPAPDLFQETLRAERDAERMKGAYDAGAVAVNVFLVPGRAITCVLGGAVGVVVLAATFGTGYRAASSAVHEGCGGKWVVTGDDLRPDARARGGSMESY
ncbi:MAG TPA: hypothetical protein VGD07_22455 [Methylomirabilota bacterium]